MAAPTTSKNDIFHLIFYGSAAILFLVLIVGWYQGNRDTLSPSAGGSLFISTARLWGLTAGFAVLMQVFLMSRMPLVDQKFNLHEIVRLHRWNGYAIVGFIFLHILEMSVGYAMLSHVNAGSQFLTLIHTFKDVYKALVAAALIYFAVALSIGAARRRVPYEFWYFVHLVMYAAILLAIFHQINTGNDLLSGWFRYYWLGLYAFTFAVWGYYRVMRIGLLAMRHNFAIDRIVQEADGIYSVYIKGKNLQKFKFEPGQYAGWRILTPRGVWQHHPYSFSGTPGKDTLRFTVNSGDGPFTSYVPTLKPGTKVFVDGPRGSFTAKRVATKPVVLVAGGIGVAPYISLIPDLLQTNHDVSLLYAARAPENSAFGSELSGFEKNGLKLRNFIGSKNQRIDDAVLKDYTQSDTTFFLCGPPPMVTALLTTLHAAGVASERVVTERFSV